MTVEVTELLFVFRCHNASNPQECDFIPGPVCVYHILNSGHSIETSNRASTNDRAKLRHKVAEGRKKNRKLAKKNVQWKSRAPKDPGIPNNLPFKDQILAEIAAERQKVRSTILCTDIHIPPSDRTSGTHVNLLGRGRKSSPQVLQENLVESL